jgi:hypothetical protein
MFYIISISYFISINPKTEECGQEGLDISFLQVSCQLEPSLRQETSLREEFSK